MKAGLALTLSGIILSIVGIVISTIAFIQAYNVENYENTLQGQLSLLLNGGYYNDQLNMWINITWVGIFMAIGGVVLVFIGTVVRLIEH